MRIGRQNGVVGLVWPGNHAKRYAWDVFITHAGLLRPRPRVLEKRSVASKLLDRQTFHYAALIACVHITTSFVLVVDQSLSTRIRQRLCVVPLVYGPVLVDSAPAIVAACPLTVLIWRQAMLT